MRPILQMHLEPLHHTPLDGRVNLSRTIVALDPRQPHHPRAPEILQPGHAHKIGHALPGRGRFFGPELVVGGGVDEVGFHEGGEVGVWVALAEDGDAGLEPGWRWRLENRCQWIV